MRIHITSAHMIAEVKSHGMEFQVSDPKDETLHGRCYVTMTGCGGTG